METSCPRRLQKNYAVNGLLLGDLFDTRQNAVACFMCVCVLSLGSCQSCFKVTFYHLCFARQLRSTFVKSKWLVSGVDVWYVWADKVCSSRGHSESERIEEVEMGLRGWLLILRIKKNYNPVFYWTK